MNAAQAHHDLSAKGQVMLREAAATVRAALRKGARALDPPAPESAVSARWTATACVVRVRERLEEKFPR